ncbi:MAG: PEP-CTERM sorting domain-containing protein [Planctomycetes bacterium]|nr:PEP-CTERM sorting domain-containing protein [Planctomycetota bacterium]
MKRLFVFGLVLALGSIAQANPVTIATFEDPSATSTDWLFEIMNNGDNGDIIGGWTGSGLDLKVPSASKIYTNTWFRMTILLYGGGISGETGAGAIEFYTNGGVDSILKINFAKAFLSQGGLASNWLYSSESDIKITGVDFAGELTGEASFGFVFTNYVIMPDDGGFTATAAFVSSAITPEPATMALFGLGGLLLRRKRKA